MRIGTQRAIDRFVGAALCRILSLFRWRYREVPPGFAPRSILVILLSEMGSLVLSKPMFDLLRQRYPVAAIHLLLFERNREALEVVNIVPDKDVLTIDDRSLLGFALSTLRSLSKLRRMKIDTAIDGELFSRVSSLLSWASGAKVRVGFHPHTQEGLYRGGFINRPVVYNPYAHFSLQLTAMVDSIGCRGVPLVKKVLRMPPVDVAHPLPDSREKMRFYERLERDFPTLGKADLVLVYPGGGLLPIRAWPLEHYRELVSGLTQRGYTVAVIGKKEDKRLSQDLAMDGKCLDLTGYTATVKELVFLIQRSVLLIGNDGGPAHFASLSSTPTIVFFGPETPQLYGPLGKDVHCFHTPLSCSPCLTAYNHRKTPCDGHNLCLKLIPPETVLEKACELIGRRASRTVEP